MPASVHACLTAAESALKSQWRPGSSAVGARGASHLRAPRPSTSSGRPEQGSRDGRLGGVLSASKDAGRTGEGHRDQMGTARTGPRPRRWRLRVVISCLTLLAARSLHPHIGRRVEGRGRVHQARVLIQPQLELLERPIRKPSPPTCLRPTSPAAGRRGAGRATGHSFSSKPTARTSAKPIPTRAPRRRREGQSDIYVQDA